MTGGGGPTTRSPLVLPVLVFSQFAGTSLWFAGNAILGDLKVHFQLGEDAVSQLTSAVQLGFIAGTLVFAFLNLSDRISPRWLFFGCSLLGAASNLAVYALAEGLGSLLICRFATGVCLAGIYPVGMKIAASWYDRGLGQALGLLVGALVLGTGFPHLLRGLDGFMSWQAVLMTTSALAAGGGLLLLLCIRDGPYLPRRSRFNPRALFVIFRSPDFRSSAFGYFGHMWELYAVWAFVPFWLRVYPARHGLPALNVPLWSFAIIAVGGVGCVLGGMLSRRLGSGSVAATQLLVSGVCCLVSPLFFSLAPLPVFLAIMFIWGITVVGDSPQYSTLNARTAPREYVGSALTIVTSIGFAITIPSIRLIDWMQSELDERFLFLPLCVGPLLGLLSLRRLLGAPFHKSL